MTQAIRDWLRACPLIDPDDLFCVEYICPDPLSYSLQEKHGRFPYIGYRKQV